MRKWIVSIALLAGLALPVQAKLEAGFKSLFDGKSLQGWKLVKPKGPGYVVQNGVLICPENGGGNLFTELDYQNFILRFEFRLKDGSNNGVAIRAPLEGDAHFLGMEIQVLDDNSSKYAGKIQPWQRHGSLYGVIPAKPGALKKTGEWNSEEIVCDGRKIRVKLNGKVILDTDLNQVTDPEVLLKHPGLLRQGGHIGFLGHDSHVEYRNIRIRELGQFATQNFPPSGFTPLFNGKDLTGWKGLVEDPEKRAKMSLRDLDAAQTKADQRMREHWTVENGILMYDGKGDSLCTTKDYGDFEMVLDWKITEKGDSGVYVRGTPQIQIWDNPVGSGGLFNNEKNPSKPLAYADHFVGDWNRMRILMVGERVHVFLNDVLVVNNTILENFWDRKKPIYPTGQIELQNHGNPLYFKNIFIRPLSR